MFKAFLAVNSLYERITDKEILREKDSDHRAVQEFVRGLRSLAFYEDLRSAMARNGHGYGGTSRKRGVQAHP